MDLKKPYIVATFLTDDSEECFSREITVFGETEARNLFDKMVRKDIYSYVGLWKTSVSSKGILEYENNGEIASHVSEDFKWQIEEAIKHGTDIKKKPFFVTYEENYIAYEESDERYYDLSGDPWDV